MSLTVAQRLHDRNLILAKDGILSQTQLEDSRRALEIAKAAEVAARAQSRSASAGSDLKLAEANDGGRGQAGPDPVTARQGAPCSPALSRSETRYSPAGSSSRWPWTSRCSSSSSPTSGIPQIKVGQEGARQRRRIPDRRFPARPTRGPGDARGALST
jgi:multidrug efflux pump subunit AcrA (membrane-fusion protein)